MFTQQRRRPGLGFNQNRQQQKNQIDDPSKAKSKTVWIGDLTTNDLDEMTLTTFFSGEPGFIEVKILKDKLTGKNLGYGFIEFGTHEEAANFLQNFAGVSIPGYPDRKFRLNWASFGVGKNNDGTNFSVFVGDLASDITDIVLFEVFKRNYKSCSGAKVVMDTTTQKSKGYGFVKFEDGKDVKMAIKEMNGKFVLGRQIKVAPAVQKKEIDTTKQSWKTQLKTVYQVTREDFRGNTGVYVGNLNSSIVEENLYKEFSIHGQIDDIKIPPSELRVGYIRFATRMDAEKSVISMNGKMIKNATVNVCFGSLKSKTICVNTLVQEQAEEEEEEKIKQWKEYYYQQWLSIQQYEAMKKYYRDMKKKIPGNKSYVDNFNKRFNVNKYNRYYKKNHFDSLYFFDAMEMD